MARGRWALAAGIVAVLIGAGIAVAVHHDGDSPGPSAPGYHAVRCPPSIVAIFLKPGSDQSQLDNARQRLRQAAPNAHVVAMDQAAAYEEFKVLLPDEASNVGQYDLPPSLRLQLPSVADGEHVMQWMKNEPGVIDALRMVPPTEDGLPPYFIDMADYSRHTATKVALCQRRR